MNDPREATWPFAEDDEHCGRAWDKIMAIARDHCLIVQAYGGVATLAMPVEQRRNGCRRNVLLAHERRGSSDDQAT